MFEQLEKIEKRYQELEHLLASYETVSDKEQYNRYAKELSDLKEPVFLFREYKKINKETKDLEAALGEKHDHDFLALARAELEELKKKYGDSRRTDIVGEAEELEVEDLIADEDVVVTISHGGYIKRLPVSSYRKQKRGGSGSMGAELKEEDLE